MVRAVITDNHWSYAHSRDVADPLAVHDAERRFIKANRPWQNGKVERFNRTLANGRAYRQPWLTDRTAAFTTWLARYNAECHHHAVGAAPSPECHQRDGRVHLDARRTCWTLIASPTKCS